MFKTIKRATKIINEVADKVDHEPLSRDEQLARSQQFVQESKENSDANKRIQEVRDSIRSRWP